jgi:hypothetical protein
MSAALVSPPAAGRTGRTEMAYNPVGHRLCERCSVIPRRDAMKSTKRGKGKPATKRGLKDLAPKKALIGNFPR